MAICLIPSVTVERDKGGMKSTSRLFLPALTAVALTIAAAISLARGAEVRAGDIAVVAAWARATPPGASTGAAYLTIENRGAVDDRLLSAATPAARAVMPHETVEAGGIARMRPIETPAIPAGGRLEMTPGGMHLMLMDIAHPLREGENIPLTLVFERAGSLIVEAPIGAMGGDTPPHQGM